MELVYLWVEEYKNIKRQGFNFSPRFRCEFDAESENLEIIDKDDTKELYSNNFFGEYLNLSAIVGENGSGKSSILKLLFRIIYSINEEKVKNNNYFLLYMNDNVLHVLNYGGITINSNKRVNENIFSFNKQMELVGKDNYSLLLDFTLSRFGFKNEVEENYKKNYSLEPSKIIYAHTHHDKINTEAFVGNVKNFGLSGYIYLDLNNIDISEYIPSINEIKLVKKSGNNRLEDFSILVQYKKEICSLLSINEINDFTLEYLDSKINKKKFEYLSIKDKYLEYEDIFYLLYVLYDFSPVFEGQFEFDSLSSGQTFILCYIGYLSKYLLFAKKNHKKSLTIYLDECENSLHPYWQKKIIKLFTDITKREATSEFIISLVIISHSPFIVSDIPKENVIFLEKGKQVYPFENGQTFGANIHTLLSHGFFMKDGLMGEFAKEKINTIIKNLNDVNYNPVQEEKEKVLNTIKIIGEDFLKTKLLDMFYKKFNDNYLKEKRKEELKFQKEMIEKELESL